MFPSAYSTLAALASSIAMPSHTRPERPRANYGKRVALKTRTNENGLAGFSHGVTIRGRLYLVNHGTHYRADKLVQSGRVRLANG